MLTLEEVQSKIYKLGRKIGLCKSSPKYPRFSSTTDVSWCGTYICVDDSKYYYLAMERGQVVFCRESQNLDDIIYEVFLSITQSMASDYELRRRRLNSKADSRIILFRKQAKLMGKIAPSFREKSEEYHKEILKISPFRCVKK